MFGYLSADILSLDKENKRIYKSFYCGLCEALSQQFGNVGRLTLTYDLTFIGILLTDVYSSEVDYKLKHCPLHHLTKVEVRSSKYFEFAADMNILMSYYKNLDDINDDNSSKAKLAIKKLESFKNEVELKYPEKCQIIKTNMQKLSEIEESNVLNPDIPANIFGQIMAELFYIENDHLSETLKNLGFHLGRYIYLLDAVVDFKDDLRKGSYNPLIALENVDKEKMLELVLEEANYYYKSLEIDKFSKITDNIVYAGLWSGYDRHKALERKK